MDLQKFYKKCLDICVEFGHMGELSVYANCINGNEYYWCSIWVKEKCKHIKTTQRKGVNAVIKELKILLEMDRISDKPESIQVGKD